MAEWSGMVQFGSVRFGFVCYRMECFAGLGGQKLANNKSRQKVQPTANRKSNSQGKNRESGGGSERKNSLKS